MLAIAPSRWRDAVAAGSYVWAIPCAILWEHVTEKGIGEAIENKIRAKSGKNRVTKTYQHRRVPISDRRLQVSRIQLR